MLALLSTVRPTMAPSSTVKRWAPFMWTHPFSDVPSNRLIQPSAGWRRRARSGRRGLLAILRQREGDDRVAGLRRVLAAAAGGDGDVLPAVDHVEARRGVAAGGQLVLPQHASRALLERPDLLVRGRGDEDHPAGRRHRAAEIERAGVADALLDQLRVFAERHLPDDVALDEIDGVQRAPGRRDRRHAVRIEEQRVAVDRVAIGSASPGSLRPASPGGVFRNAASALELARAELPERRHGVAALRDRPSRSPAAVRLRSTSAGVCGGVPWRAAPWQAAQVRS